MTADINYLQPKWPAPARVRACTIIRNDNLTFSTTNIPQLVHSSGILQKALSLPAMPSFLQQQHGNKIINLDYTEEKLPASDASFATKKNIVCAVLTADCLPILLTDKKGSMVAAIHAGWRGLAAGVITNTLTKFASATDLLVWLGPAIGPDAFIVGKNVINSFSFNDAFTVLSDGKWLVNIYELAKIELLKLGVLRENIFGGNWCSYSDERFYSYRRDNGCIDRMVSLIFIS